MRKIYLSLLPVFLLPCLLPGQTLKIFDSFSQLEERIQQAGSSILVINFWATWCGPCKIEMPAMERLYRSFSRKEFEILAVSTDAQGTVVTRPFQQEVGFTFPVLHDADFRIGLQYGARQLPMTFLIDRKGIIRNRIPGARDWSAPAGKRLVEALLQEPSHE